MRRLLTLLATIVLVGSCAPAIAAPNDARIAALEARVTALEARVTALEHPASPAPPPTTAPSSPPPTPEPTVAPTPTPIGGAYGTLAADSKANLRLSAGLDGAVAHRFRASTSSVPTAIRWPQRGGPVYSAGTGGMIEMSVRADAGGVPGPILTSVRRAFGNPPAGQPASGWSTFFDTPFPTGPALVEGTIYWVVFDNVDPDEAANFTSINDIYAWGPVDPRDPVEPDAEVFTLRRHAGRPVAWELEDAGYSPVMDLTYADGTHDGIGYIESFYQFYQPFGGAAKVRERFTPTASRSFTELGVRLRRTAGTGALTISLAGQSWAVAASSVPTTSPGGTLQTLAGSVWAKVPVAVTLAAGTEYQLVLSAPSGTAYGLTPVREGTDSGDFGGVGNPTGFRSDRFTDGLAEESTDGSTWTRPYDWSPNDWQFYLR